jgi:hypothetical protein
MPIATEHLPPAQSVVTFAHAPHATSGIEPQLARAADALDA